MRKFTLFAATALAISLAGAASAQTLPAQIRATNGGEGATLRSTEGGDAQGIVRGTNGGEGATLRSTEGGDAQGIVRATQAKDSARPVLR